MDIVDITKPITKKSYLVTSVEALADTLREAFSIARSDRPRPVLIDVPKDVQNSVLNRKTNFPALAKAFGADGETVNDLEGLDSALQRAFACKGLYLIDCRIDRDEFVLPMCPPNGSMDDIIIKKKLD